MLIDVDLISRDDLTMIVNQHKIRREVQKVRRKATEADHKRLIEDKLQVVFCNGKEIETLTVERDGVFRQKKEKQEHIVLVGEPGKKTHRIGHIIWKSCETNCC